MNRNLDELIDGISSDYNNFFVEQINVPMIREQLKQSLTKLDGTKNSDFSINGFRALYHKAFIEKIAALFSHYAHIKRLMFVDFFASKDAWIGFGEAFSQNKTLTHLSIIHEDDPINEDATENMLKAVEKVLKENDTLYLLSLNIKGISGEILNAVRNGLQENITLFSFFAHKDAFKDATQEAHAAKKAIASFLHRNKLYANWFAQIDKHFEEIEGEIHRDVKDLKPKLLEQKFLEVMYDAILIAKSMVNDEKAYRERTEKIEAKLNRIILKLNVTLASVKDYIFTTIQKAEDKSASSPLLVTLFNLLVNKLELSEREFSAISLLFFKVTSKEIEVVDECLITGASKVGLFSARKPNASGMRFSSGPGLNNS